MTTFGFEEYEAELSTWDNGASGKYDGSPDQWQLAENALKKATDRLGMKVTVMTDEAAFYGPKIDVKLVDAIGRKWQLSTVQFDFTLPRRFGLEYIARRRQSASAADGASRAVRIHRTILRHSDRALRRGVPGLAARRCRRRCFRSRTSRLEYAKQVRDQLEAAGIRVTLDDRSEKVNLKIRDAQLQKVPYMLVVGGREAEQGTVSVRNRKHGGHGRETGGRIHCGHSQLIDSKVFIGIGECSLAAACGL